MSRLSEFRTACLDYLEGETTAVPSLEGMTPREKRRAREWLENLILCRELGPLMIPRGAGRP